MSQHTKQTAPATPPVDEPMRRGWVLHQGGELGWTLREVVMPESEVERWTETRWPAEIMAVVLGVLERRIGRKLVERLDG